LAEGESLISRDGYWVGRHFLRVRRASEAESGVLARGQEIERLALERDEREAELAVLDERLTHLRENQRAQEEQREQQSPAIGRAGQGRTTDFAPYSPGQ
jgi:chromosome segregation protein